MSASLTTIFTAHRPVHGPVYEQILHLVTAILRVLRIKAVQSYHNTYSQKKTLISNTNDDWVSFNV